jgi:pilus assembly protein Flp/PilA
MRKRQETGASAVEYGLLIAAIAAVLATVALSLGGVVRDAFASHTSCFSSHMNSGPTSC